MVLDLDGQLWSVVWFQHHKPGKGNTVVRTKLKHVLSGRSSIARSTPTPRSTRPTSTGGRCSTSTTTAPGSSSWTPHLRPAHDHRRTVGDAKNYLLEGQTATVALHEGSPLYLELPASVELEITYTEPGLQGDRSTGGTKPATVETGLQFRCRCSSPRARRSRSTPVRVNTSVVSEALDGRGLRLDPEQGPQAGPGHLVRGGAARHRPARDPGRADGRRRSAGPGLHRARRRGGRARGRIDARISASVASGWSLARMPRVDRTPCGSRCSRSTTSTCPMPSRSPRRCAGLGAVHRRIAGLRQRCAPRADHQPDVLMAVARSVHRHRHDRRRADRIPARGEWRSHGRDPARRPHVGALPVRRGELPRRRLLGAGGLPSGIRPDRSGRRPLRAGVRHPAGRPLYVARHRRRDGRGNLPRRPLRADIGRVRARPRAGRHLDVPVEFPALARSADPAGCPRGLQPGGGEPDLGHGARPASPGSWALPAPEWSADLSTLPGDEVVRRLGGDRQRVVDFLLSCRSGSGFTIDLRPPTDVTNRAAQPVLVLATRDDGSVGWEHPAHLGGDVAAGSADRGVHTEPSVVARRGVGPDCGRGQAVSRIRLIPSQATGRA